MVQRIATSDQPALEGTALVYDFLLVPGGAEQVFLHTLERHRDWRGLVGFVTPSAFPTDALPLDRLSALAGPSTLRGWQGLKVLRAFERKAAQLATCDRVLFSGVYAPAGVRHRPATGNFYYCHTPPRFAYDLEDWYLERAAAWQRPALRWLARRVRAAYGGALARMNRVAANSRTVRDRLRRHLGLSDVTVIHPPVNTAAWQCLGQDDFYLSNARLEPYKRVDWAVRAFAGMPDRKLVVTSGGSELSRLQRLAAGHDNIRFTGWCDTATLRELTGRCIATLYLARDEDFGMSPVESMAAGKPVIGVAEGGLRETVVPGKTGMLLPPEAAEDPEALREVVRALDGPAARAMQSACEARAARFAPEAYDRSLDRFLGLA